MFLKLFLPVVFLFFQMFHHGDFRSNAMYKKTLSNKDALCNDGTRAVYFLGLQNTSKWIVFLESGAYCLTRAQCLERFGNEYTSVLMTSKHMPNTIRGRDLLSTSRKENRLFHDYSRVLIPYCSSDAWLGTETKAANSNNSSAPVEQFVFSGKIIFQSVIFELLSQDLNQAREVVLVGSSAGAVGVYNQVQWLQDLLSSRGLDVSLSAIVDGGWFIDFQESIASKVTKEFYNSAPLSRACADSSYGYPCCLSASCMLARGYYPSNVPTLFLFSMYDIYIIGDIIERSAKIIVMADNGANDLLTLIDLYGGAMNQSLFSINPSSSNLSYFVPACFQHTFFSMSSLRDQGELLHFSRVFTQGNALFGLTKKAGTWLSTAIRHGNETISLQSSLFKWAKTRDQPVRVIDRCLGPMCNPTCPELLRFVDTAVDWGEVLNGIVLIVSLVLTVVCVAAKICFWVQLVLQARSRRRYLEKHKSSQVSVYEPGEAITLIYSSPEASKHSPSCENLHEMAQENIKEHSRRNDKDRLSDDCTAKGYNAIFYRTVQYLRMVFTQRHSYNQMEKHDFYTDQVEPQGRKESYGIAPTGSDQDIGLASCYRTKDFCTRGIHNATLSFKQGEFIAIIGKPGAGKTTLLKLLSGRLTCGCKQEHVFVNGVGQMEIHDNYASKIGFLSQFTIPYYRKVTVRQYLLLAAFMRMPRNMNNTAKYERVEQIISEMKLTSVADMTFGGSCKKKLTELQKRLLCLAVQLITRPLVIFLDEPITGLDSASSMEMLNILRRLCNNGHLVIITTQALPGQTAQLFNQLVLLSDKQVIYNGEPARLSDYYNRVSEDNSEKPHKGLEDIISDILQSKKIKDAMVVQKQLEKIEKDAFHPKKGEKNILPAPRNSLDNGGLLTRLFAIECRASLSSTLGQTAYLSFMFSLFGLTAGIVYWQADTPLQIITAYCGSSIPSLLLLSSVILSRVNKSLEIRRLESSENVGYPYEHVIQTFLSTSAACVLPVIACSALTYFMVMTSYNWWRFFLVTVISLVLNQTWIAVYIMVIYVTPSNVCHAGGAITILAGFSGGFIVTRDQMPIGYNLFFYINPQFYGYSAITKVLLQNVRLKCEYESALNCISSDGNAVLSRFCFDSVNPYGHLVIMLCMTVLSLLFSWLLCDARSSR